MGEMKIRSSWKQLQRVNLLDCVDFNALIHLSVAWTSPSQVGDVQQFISDDRCGSSMGRKPPKFALNPNSFMLSRNPGTPG